jgi:hypothetical protein
MLRIITAAILFSLVLISACKDKVDPTYNPAILSFNLTPKGVPGSGRTNGLENANNIIISLKRDDGTPIFNQKEMPLIKSEGKFLTESIALMPGTYQLTLFVVRGDNNGVMYAAPIEGSEFAALVQHPLPLSITVTSDQTLVQELELVDVTSQDPERFGYHVFDLKLTNKKLVRFVANLNSINEPIVRTWVRNIDTYERQWVTLVKMADGTYKGSTILNGVGVYEFEAMAQWNEGMMRYVKSQVVTAALSGNFTINFNQINESSKKRIYSFEYLTVTTPLDFCDPGYTLYVAPEVCNGYFIIDKLVLTSGQVIYLGEDEVTFSETQCTPVGDNIVVNTGKLLRTISMQTDACEIGQSGYEASNSFAHGEMVLRTGQSRSYHMQDQYKPESAMSQID